MKPSSFHRAPAAILFTLLLAGGTACAQMPGSGTPGGVNAALAKLFGSVSSFTARADVQVLDQAQKEWMRMPMSFTVSDGKIRVDIDAGQIKSPYLTAAILAGYKQAGLERVTSVIRPDKKVTYIIYPDAKSYATMPMSAEDAEAAQHGLKLEKTALGKETVDGHTCVKNRNVVKNQKGAAILEATTWNATDLHDFPVQIQTKDENNTTIMRFQDIKLVKPDASQFAPPAGFAAYDSPEKLILTVANKAERDSKNK